MISRYKDENVREPLKGFRDILGQEVRVKNFVADKISEVFQKWGYEQIIFPLLERASSFSEQVVGSSPWPEWDKRSVFYLHVQDYLNSYENLPEQVPSLLVPEGTISVSRWLAKLLAAKKSTKDLFPIKVFYVTPCFRNELISKLSSTKGREFNQVGVEIMGTSNILSDIEILLLIYEGFKAINIPGEMITIRIGSVEIFNLLCTESSIDENTRIVLKNSLDTIAEARAGKGPERLKPEIETVIGIINQKKLSAALMKKWDIVLNTYVTALNGQIKKDLGYDKQVDDLNGVAKVMQNAGINCVIDPSVVRSHEYYTGIVYEIDLKVGNQIFVEVAGGGRYNKLISKFLAGKEYQIPAVGFAYGLERISEFFRLINGSKNLHTTVNYWTGENSSDIVLYSDPKDPKGVQKLFNLSEKLRTANKRVCVYVGEMNQAKAKKYANGLGAKLVIK